MDSSEGSEKNLEERSLLDRIARPGTLEEGDNPIQEEEKEQQLYTMGGRDRDIEGEDNVAISCQEVLKAQRENDSKVLYEGQAPSLDLTASQQAQDTITRIHNNHKIKPGLFRTLTEDQLMTIQLANS